MLLELLLLSLVGCLGGGLVLTYVTKYPTRWFGEMGIIFWSTLGLLFSVIGVILSTQLRSYTTLNHNVVSEGGVWNLFELSETFISPMWQSGTLLAALLPVTTFMVLTLIKPAGRSINAFFALSMLVISGLLFVCTSSLIFMFVAFELLLLVSLYLLRLSAKTDRVVEAVSEMFFWTLAGSVGLFLGITLLVLNGVTTLTQGVVLQNTPGVVVMVLCFGFGVKLPIWPCFSWLLKAHVEASVEFSILLSGIVVKFGVLGIQRVLLLQDGGISGFVLAACCTIAIVEASLRLLAQRDLKRIVALTTVIEVNWIGVCIGLGGSTFERVGVLVLVAHSFTTTAEFYMVECIYRRYHTRDIFSLAGLAAQAPSLFALSFLNILTTIGFPGTSLFAGKLLFLAALSQYSMPLFSLFSVILVLWLPLVFMRIWVPVWYGQLPIAQPMPDLLSREAAILLLCVVGSVWLGLFPSAILMVS